VTRTLKEKYGKNKHKRAQKVSKRDIFRKSIILNYFRRKYKNVIKGRTHKFVRTCKIVIQARIQNGKLRNKTLNRKIVQLDI